MNHPLSAGLALAVLSLGACTASRSEPVRESVLHLVTHEQGTCRVCDLYHQAHGSVVRVVGPSGLGAGVVVSATGLVVTNAHVAGNGAQLAVQFFDGGERPAQLVLADADQDLAVLRFSPEALTLVPISMTAGEPPPIGSEVYAIGHPVGLSWTVTRGIISGYRRIGGVEMIQTDAPISPGNSGGPLIDRDGRLVGLVTSKVTVPGAENIAFARPFADVRVFIERVGL